MIEIPNNGSQVPQEQPLLYLDQTIPQDNMTLRSRIGGRIHESKDHLADVFHTGIDEIKDDEHIGRTVASVGVTALTQTADRARISLVLIPAIATTILENQHNAPLAAVLTGGYFLGWNALVGTSLADTLSRTPKTVASVEHNYPAITQIFSDAMPGITNKRLDEEPKELTTKEKIGLRIRRAGVAIGIGTTGIVGAASLNGYSRKEAIKTNFDASIDGGVLVGAIVGSVGEGIILLGEHGHPGAAMNIQNVASDTRIWLGVAAVSIGSELIKNRKAKQSLNQTLKP